MPLFPRRDRSVAEALFEGGHITEDAVLRHLDGELPPAQAAAANEHLLSCWACRSRRQAMEEAIGAVVNYENTVAAPWLPPPPEGRARFLARLEALAAEMERPSPLARWMDAASRPFAALATRRVTQIAALLAVAGGSFLAFVIRPSHSVSADEILNRAIASETTSLRATAAPVVVQKLRISINGHSITRTIYRDTRGHRTASPDKAQQDDRELARAAYVRSALDWDAPLDAESYRRWCSRHAGTRLSVARRGADRITLETHLPSGSVTRADLTLRAHDFHAIEENLHFDDDSRLEIAELSYAVVPFGTVSQDIFGASLASSQPQLPAVAALRPMLPTRAELAQAEIEDEAVLHRLGADLGEEINVTVRGNRRIVIDGVVADDRRRQQLVAALQGIGFTAVRLSTVSELAQRSSPGARPAPATVQVMSAAPPLLDAELSARFTDKDQRNTYVNQTLSMAQSASARAWALNRLADRHPASALALLDESSRRELRGLLLDHVAALREDLSSLANQLSPVLSPSSNTPAANTATPVPAAPGHAGAPEDWQERIRRVHSSTEAIHEAVATLLTTSPTDRGGDAETIEVNLRTSLTQVQAELQSLEEQLQKEVVN
jgi:hypothetical protein